MKVPGSSGSRYVRVRNDTTRAHAEDENANGKSVPADVFSRPTGTRTTPVRLPGVGGCETKRVFPERNRKDCRSIAIADDDDGIIIVRLGQACGCGPVQVYHIPGPFGYEVWLLNNEIFSVQFFYLNFL